MFIVLTAAKDRSEASYLDFTCPTDWQLDPESRCGHRRRATGPDGHRDAQQHHPDRGSVTSWSSSGGDGRLRPAAPSRPSRRPRQRPGPRRARDPAGDRADDLRAAGDGPLQDVAWTHPGRGGLPAAVLRPHLPGLRVARSRASSTRPRSWTARVRVTLFAKVIFPLLRPAIITVIVVASVVVYNDFVNPLYFLPGKDNATVQLTLFNFQSQFRHAVEPAFRGRAADHDPAARDVHLLPATDRVGLTAGSVKG